MNVAETYREKQKLQLTEWELECRSWLSLECDQPIAAIFCKDGIIDPEIWFKRKFRPLFILKEANNKAQENRCLDLIAMKEGSDYNIWERVGMWRALGALAEGLIRHVGSGEALPSYEELFARNITEYRETLRQIAVINVKKLAGGGRGTSKESLRTLHFTAHAKKFANKLQEQIKLIQPTIIVVCCGPAVKDCFQIQGNRLYGIPTVIGLHPSTNANCRRTQFYNETILRASNAYAPR